MHLLRGWKRRRRLPCGSACLWQSLLYCIDQPGEEREFAFRSLENEDDIYRLDLKSGSLLVMGKGCQENYQHALPYNDEYKNPRINLTFRPFGWNEALRTG
ncbi:MAG: hypothetical protein HOM58_06130 [Rhodospirillaceae bacterium]|nr:hypothetical protein [Rhodospirillaceae bacterium]MBT5458601.1 hypothetical protein [Rhodospirillaceae bacterium]